MWTFLSYLISKRCEQYTDIYHHFKNRHYKKLHKNRNIYTGVALQLGMHDVIRLREASDS